MGYFSMVGFHCGIPNTLSYNFLQSIILKPCFTLSLKARGYFSKSCNAASAAIVEASIRNSFSSSGVEFARRCATCPTLSKCSKTEMPGDPSFVVIPKNDSSVSSGSFGLRYPAARPASHTSFIAFSVTAIVYREYSAFQSSMQLSSFCFLRRPPNKKGESPNSPSLIVEYIISLPRIAKRGVFPRHRPGYQLRLPHFAVHSNGCRRSLTHL